jgi:hypothetical protein
MTDQVPPTSNKTFLIVATVIGLLFGALMVWLSL